MPNGDLCPLLGSDGRFPAPIDLTRTLIQTPEGPISWATYEPFRPGASQTAAVTLQATADFSKTHLEAVPTDICDQLLAAFAEQQNIPLPHPSYSAAHRWRYAKVDRPARKMSCFISPIRTAASLLPGTGTRHKVMMGALEKGPALKMRFYLACGQLHN